MRGLGTGWQPDVDPEEWAVRAKATKLILLRSAAWLLGLVVLYFVIPLDETDWPIGLALGLAAIAAIVPVTMRRIRHISTSDYPMGDAIQAVALLLGLTIIGFACINYATAVHTDQFNGLETKIDGLYFTIVSVATIGYGDITPTGQLARSLVTIEIVVNFTLLAVSLKLVAGVAQYRQQARGLPEAVRQRLDGPSPGEAHSAPAANDPAEGQGPAEDSASS